jgi:AsmA family protein
MADSRARPISADLPIQRAPAPRRAAVARTWRDIPAPLRWLGAILSLLAIAVAIFVSVFQWNWLRGPLDDYLSARMHRQVVIHGDLSAHIWSWTPSATAAGITVAQPAWAGAGPMATLPRLTIALDLKALLGGRLVLTQVDAEHPSVDLRRDAAGRENWNFGPPGQPAPPLRLPPIRHFTIEDGRLVLDDAQRKLHFVARVSSNEQINGYARGRFALTGRGTLNATPFTADITGGPLIDVDPDRPYPFKTDIHAGGTHVVADGTIPRPFDLGVFQASGHVSGEDLANLYYLTGLTFPSSPPYFLAGRMNRNGDRIDIAGLTGRIGTSDIAGHLVAIKPPHGRADLTGELVSRRLKLADLAATIGGAPRGALKGAVVSPTEQAEANELTAEHRILPDARLDIGRMRQMDADIRYRAESVDAGPLPVRQLSLRARLDNGLLTIDPLALTLPQGALAGSVRLNARGATPVTTINLALTNAQVQELLPASKGPPPFTGALQARARLTGAGASVRTAAGAANGVVAVVIPQGQMRQLLAELMGIDVGRSLFLYLAKDQKPTPVRCAVAEFKAQDGVLTAQRLLIDTGVVLAQGKGTINLRDETLDLSLSGKPKHVSLLRIAAPITLKGRLDDPKPGVDIVKALPQLGVSAALGVFAAPAAAILPFIVGGGAKDANCAALLAEAEADGAPVGR